MTFDEFMRLTREMDVAAEAKVLVYDGDAEEVVEVTGILLHENGNIEILTDTM
jgi:hypothetical protein